MIPTPQPGFVHLVLKDPFYLKIPISIVTTLCLKPLKYLRYIGWCVLGVDGAIVDKHGNRNQLGGLIDQGVYKYVVGPAINIFAQAVDLEVIKQRSRVPSETTQTCEDFSTRVSERDGRCVWTGMPFPVAMHIIPYRRGNEWLQVIIVNRPHHEEDLSLIHINDIRNGISAVDHIHNRWFEPRKVVILKKTPNPILDPTDIPTRYVRPLGIPDDVSYPSGSRYTLQWIVTPDVFTANAIPNNNDATFKDQTLAKPSDLLLHYNYGAAALRQWGRNSEIITERSNIPRPKVPAPAPAPAPMGPPRVGTADHATKRRCVGGSTFRENTNCENIWDEDDIMVYFWGNSPAARERHARKEEERRDYMEKWRSGVSNGSEWKIGRSSF